MKKKTLHYKWEQPHKNLDLKILIRGVRENKWGRWIGGGKGMGQ